MTPVGIATGMYDTGRELGKGNAVGAGLNTLAMFAGPAAKTANHVKLDIAKRLSSGGHKPEKILQETGWFKGDDNKWRFEIDDSNSLLRLAEPQKYRLDRLDDQLIHDDLYAAYPDLKAAPLDLGSDRTLPPSGRYNANNDAISVSGAQPKESLFHEIQHAIQEREGFALGGSPTDFGQQSDAKLAFDALSFRKEIDAIAPQYPVQKRAEIVRRKYKEMGVEDWLPPMEAQALALDYEGNPDGDLQDIVRLYGLDRKTTPETDMTLYKNLGGEVEARNASRRMNFSKEQRQQQPPWATEDVPSKLKVIRTRKDL